MRGRLRRHVRACADCRTYADGVARQSRQFGTLLPLAPSLLLKYRTLEDVLGIGAADPAALCGRRGRRGVRGGRSRGARRRRSQSARGQGGGRRSIGGRERWRGSFGDRCSHHPPRTWTARRYCGSVRTNCAVVAPGLCRAGEQRGRSGPVRLSAWRTRADRRRRDHVEAGAQGGRPSSAPGQVSPRPPPVAPVRPRYRRRQAWRHGRSSTGRAEVEKASGKPKDTRRRKGTPAEERSRTQAGERRRQTGRRRTQAGERRRQTGRRRTQEGARRTQTEGRAAPPKSEEERQKKREERRKAREEHKPGGGSSAPPESEEERQIKREKREQRRREREQRRREREERETESGEESGTESG